MATVVASEKLEELKRRFPAAVPVRVKIGESRWVEGRVLNVPSETQIQCRIGRDGKSKTVHPDCVELR